MLAAFSAAFGLAVISPFLPELAEHHGANGFWIGMIFAGFGISRGIITPFIGSVSDKTGRKIFVVGGLLIYALASLFYIKADSVYLLTLARLVHGLSAGMILPIVMTYVGELSKQGTEGLATGTLNMVLHIGIAAGPLLGGEIAERFGFDAVFYTMAVLGVVTMFLVMFFLPEVKGHIADLRPAKKSRFGALMKNNYVKSLLLMTFISAALTAVFISFVPSIAIKDYVDMIHIGFVISLSIFISGILQIPFGKIADHYDRPGKLLQAGAGIAASMIAIVALPFCPDFTALLVSGCVMGIGIAISTPALSGISVDLGKKIGMGKWMGIFWSVMSAALVVAPIAAGIIMDYSGVNSVFYSFGIFTFFAVLLAIYYVLKKQAKNRA